MERLYASNFNRACHNLDKERKTAIKSCNRERKRIFFFFTIFRFIRNLTMHLTSQLVKRAELKLNWTNAVTSRYFSECCTKRFAESPFAYEKFGVTIPRGNFAGAPDEFLKRSRNEEIRDVGELCSGSGLMNWSESRKERRAFWRNSERDGSSKAGKIRMLYQRDVELNNREDRKESEHGFRER